MPCELITSGWFASEQARNYRTKGDDLIRGQGFRPLWWRSIDTYLKPEHVFIVDSASPVKSNDAEHTSTKFQTVELLINPGHSQNSTTHYSGWTAGIILGLEFALLSDVDMFLYVEQDVLVYGSGMVEKIKNSLRRKDLVFGASSSMDIQQSFVAANKRGIRQFVKALHSIEYSDKDIAPEHKFMFAASRGLPAAAAKFAVHTEHRKLKAAGIKVFAKLCDMSKNYEVLPFGYGRLRPINFTDEAFYFQHGSAAEIAQYRQLTGF